MINRQKKEQEERKEKSFLIGLARRFSSLFSLILFFLSLSVFSSSSSTQLFTITTTITMLSVSIEIESDLSEMVKFLSLSIVRSTLINKHQAINMHGEKKERERARQTLFS